jgi:hypothetical protein
MAKTTAPLLSFGSRGQIGKTMVASKWRGINYMRQYVVPGNPNTIAQQAVRKLFAYLREMWKLAPGGVQDAWNAFAAGRPFLGVNKWVGENVRVLNGETDMNAIIFSPGARGGLPPVGVTVSAGGNAGEIAITGSAPTAPTGWTFQALCAAAVPDGNPTTFFAGPFVYGEDTSSTYAITLAGLGAGIECQVGVWARWLKPNGDLAYSVSTTYQQAAAS